MDPISHQPRPPALPIPERPHDAKLWAVAQDLEASFLAEMLKGAGLAKTPESLGGGAGEEQFSSFLVREYADAAVRAGGIGLSESIYRSLVKDGEG